MKLALCVLSMLLLAGCMTAEQAARWNRASQAGLSGVNEFYASHPPLVLPPSPCYGCGR